MIAFWFVMAALAVYRVSRMLALEDGPFDLFSELRGRIDPAQATWLGRGVNCPLCISFWVGGVGAVWLGFNFGLNVLEGLCLALALSGAATWLYKREAK